jgi:hypothetical protein
LAWHFTACRLKDGSNKKIIKPCMFKEIKTVLMAPPQASPGSVR